MALRRLVALGVVMAAGGALAVACSSSTGRGTFDSPDTSILPVDEAGGGGDGPSLIDPDGSTTGACPADSPTRITGKVYDPAGKNALYNIQVFVPSADLPEIKLGLPPRAPNGIQCVAQTCDSQVLNPKAAALTNTKGEFELKGPKLFPGKDIPLVMQVGKWRRKVVIPEVKPCVDNKLDATMTRLPKNGAEGDMPHMMMVLGSYDALECLLYGIGIDKDEFVPGYTEAEKNKHVHVYKGIGGGEKVNGRAVPEVNETWRSSANMSNFDIALLSCEGTDSSANKPNPNAFKNFADFGGRVFATHYHSQWITGPTNPPSSGAWDEKVLLRSGGIPGSNPYPINTSFPKGQAFSDWLYEIGASTSRDRITLSDTSTNQGGPAPASPQNPVPARSWIGTGPSTKYVSFNTPVEVPVAEQCGRFVYSDVHAAGGGSGGNDLPNSECSGLNAQLSALEFMFFDLSSCVQDETKPPEPPK